MLAFSGWASADPPSRVARLGYIGGEVTFSPAGEDDWIEASINRPLTTGDRLWADRGARAEIQVGAAMIRMDADTSVSVLNLDDQIAQLRLTQGTLNVRVRRFEPGQVLEVDTPNLAFVLRQAGEFRLDVDADGRATTIVVRKGQGEVYGEDASYVVDARQPYRFTGTDLREYEHVDVPRLDEFDRWASERDRRYDSSVSARYVSSDVIGYQDLDANGTWRVDVTYGNVWFPSRVAADWAPYRDGHWVWVDPWGWTWVDDAPWGFAVSHYGRWANLRGAWGWVPGPVRTRAWYAPALVVFVGGDNFQLTISSGNVGGVAWFPLAPREVYRPSYPVSRGYFENVNRSNTVINTTVINNYYGNTNVTNVVYANRQVPGAVVAVPRAAFVQSQPVARVAVRVPQETVASRPVAVAPPVAPTESSVRGTPAQRAKPPERVFERPVVAHTAPAAARVGLAAQLPQLEAKPGQPLDDAARKTLKPAAPAPVVKVVAPTPEAPRALRPTPAAPAAKPNESRAKPVEATVPAAPAKSGAPARGAAPSPSTPALPAAPAPPPVQRGQSGQVRTVEPRGLPPAPAPSASRAAPVEPQPAPAAAKPEQRAQPSREPAAPQRTQPPPAPAAKPAEPHPPVVVPAQARPAPDAPPQARRPAPAASKPDDNKKGGGKPERDADDPKPKQ
jgi:hypothetical protein